MDERHRRTYEAIYALIVETELPSPLQLRADLLYQFADLPGQPFGSVLGEAIEAAEQTRRDDARLREDAKALLALNFLNLVLLPLAHTRADTGAVEEDLRADIALIVAESEVDRSTPVPEITGHGIIDALSQNWGGLRISRFRLWERSDE